MALPKKAQRRFPRNDLNPEYLRSIFDYDPKTGLLRWEHRADHSPQWNGRYAGKIAGSFDSSGQIQVKIDGKIYMAHRVIWAIMTGRWPQNEIDHESTNGSDNCWDNLREATTSQNCTNRKRTAYNTSGYKGVTWHKRHKRWYASITINGRLKFIGLYDTPEEAHAAYCAQAKIHHKEFARLK